MANSKHTKSNSIDVSSPSSTISSSSSHGKGLSGGIKLHMAPLLKYKSLLGNETKEDSSSEATPPATSIVQDRAPQLPPHTPTSPTISTTEAGHEVLRSPELPSTPTIRAVTEPGTTPLRITTSTGSSRQRSHSATSSPASTHHPQMIPENREAPSASQAPASPADSANRTLPPRPGGPAGYRRSSSQEKNFFNKIKKGRDVAQEHGTKAVGMLNKFGHGAWDKLKTQRERLAAPKSSGGYQGRSASPQHGLRDNPRRDRSRDLDVFGMKLREAVERTRVQKERKSEGDVAFWIPAIAYRCIQYLNVHGPKEVGIYRVPGSTAVVDDLRADFVMYHDVDLFEHPPNDLHTVSSLLKSYLRILPEPVIPKDIQTRMYERCKDQTEGTTPPPEFVEEISRLPPYNYYLLRYLFSHLSAINDASEINKMNLPNLAMIFCPTLRMDRFAFNWLAGNFDMCWTHGCAVEEEEYQLSMQQGRRPSHTSVASSSLAPPTSSGSATGRPESKGTDADSTGTGPPGSSGSNHTRQLQHQLQTPPQSSSGKPTPVTPKVNGSPAPAANEKKEKQASSASPQSPSPPEITTTQPEPSAITETSTSASTNGTAAPPPSAPPIAINGLDSLHLQSGERSPTSVYSQNSTLNINGADGDVPPGPHTRSDSMIVQTGRLSLGNPLDVAGAVPAVAAGGEGKI